MIKKEFDKYMHESFPGLRLGKGLFYCWDTGIRFDLQITDYNKEDEYFQEVLKRSTDIFEFIFNPADDIYLILTDYKFRRRKIRSSNFIFKQIDQLDKNQIYYSIEKHLYYSNDKFDIRNVAILKSKIENIDYKNILTAIANNDFGNRKPRLDNYGFPSSKEIYFINNDKSVIFNMHDDRGLDVISTKKETIAPLYNKFNDWILNYDREKIDDLFK